MYHVHKKRCHQGFTIVELMLAMSFVSVLLVSIAMLTIQVSNIYTRGVTLRQVNEAGLEISTDLQRSLRQASNLQINDSSTSYIVQPNVGGRLCLGDFSYAWNTAQALSGNQGSLTAELNKIDTKPTPTPVRFVKVLDRGKLLCQPITSMGTITGYPNIPPSSQPNDLLLAGDRDLALYNITISAPPEGLATITLTIGTKDLTAVDATKDDTCRPPSDAESDQEYCAVNKFVIVTRIGE